MSMKKTFTLTLRSKDTDIPDKTLKERLGSAMSTEFGDDVRVVVKRAKDLDPLK